MTRLSSPPPPPTGQPGVVDAVEQRPADQHVDPALEPQEGIAGDDVASHTDESNDGPSQSAPLDSDHTRTSLGPQRSPRGPEPGQYTPSGNGDEQGEDGPNDEAVPRPEVDDFDDDDDVGDPPLDLDMVETALDDIDDDDIQPAVRPVAYEPLSSSTSTNARTPAILTDIDEGDPDAGRDSPLREMLDRDGPLPDFAGASVRMHVMSRSSNSTDEMPPPMAVDLSAAGGIGPFLLSLIEADMMREALNRSNEVRSRPTDRAVVDSLPIINVQQPCHCSICQEDLQIGARANQLPCGHVFCLPGPNCGGVKEWLSHAHSCPVCRDELPEGSPKPTPRPEGADDRGPMDGAGITMTQFGGPGGGVGIMTLGGPPGAGPTQGMMGSGVPIDWAVMRLMLIDLLIQGQASQMGGAELG